MYELSNALLSMLLFQYSLGSKFVFPRIREIDDLLTSSLSLSGSDMVRQTAAFIEKSANGDEFLGDSRVKMSLNLLGSLVPGRGLIYALPPAFGPTQEHGVRDQDKDIEEHLISTFGQGRWAKVPTNFKKSLTDAERTWRQNALLLTSGKRDDWGPITAGYCKAYELDLCDRFKKIRNNEKLKIFMSSNNIRLPSQATSGAILNLLCKRDFMTPEVRELFQGVGIDVDNTAVWGKLRDINDKYRNPAVHNRFSVVDFTKFITEFLHNGVLNDYIDATLGCPS
jgi:hypothetical protein